jgi:polar amino acid transport system substrate-binding protein
MVVGIIAVFAAPAISGTLDDIIKRGKVKIAVPIDVAPFGTVDKDGKLEGYDIDVANMIAKDLGVELEMIPTTGINRIPYLLTKKVDIVVMIFGATPERAKSVSFTIPYAPFFIGIFGPKELPVSSAEETKGYRVGVPRGTTQDMTFTDMAPEGVEIIRYEDDATTSAALLAKQVDMIGTGNLVAASLNEKNPGKFELKFVLRISPGHIGIRRNEPDLMQWLNTFIFYHRVKGDLNKLSMKWFKQPMPELPAF